MPEICQIIIADDHDFLRKGLKLILGFDDHIRIIGEAGDGHSLMNLLEGGVVPDLLILDLSMPRLTGIEALRAIRHKGFAFKVLVLTLHKEPEFLCESLCAGANGYILKDAMAKEIFPALQSLLGETLYISPALAQELPQTCRIRMAAQQSVSFSSIEHCEKYPAKSLLSSL